MEIYTIGFTQSTAERFFGRLGHARIDRLLDVRLNNSSQLAGFAKVADLPFFLDRLVGADYEHEPRLAPTQDMLDGYKKRKEPWSEYERAFLALMGERQIHDIFAPSEFDRRTALLCSEATPEHCHRRLVCDYLVAHWRGVEVVHL